jgi:hypothetical protein
MRTLIAGLVLSVLLLGGCADTSEPESAELEVPVPAETQESEDPNKEACLEFPSPGGTDRATLLLLEREYVRLAETHPTEGISLDLLNAKLKYVDSAVRYALALQAAINRNATADLQSAIERSESAVSLLVSQIDPDNVYPLPDPVALAALRTAELEADTICGSVN